MRKIFIFVLLYVYSVSIIAQADLELKTAKSKDLKWSSLPYYRYGKGLGVTTPDSSFQVKMRFMMQNRVELSSNKDGELGVGAYMKRLRLRLDGYVFSPKVLYTLHFGFAPDEVGKLKDGGNLSVIRDAFVNYVPNKNWNIIFGQTKLPGNRQRASSSGSLQLVDRSINDSKFTLESDFGLQVYRLFEKKNAFSYNFKMVISTGNGRNTTEKNDHGISYTGKIELYPLGTFVGNGAFFEGDLKRESKPKLMFSAVYNYNDRAMKTQGTQGSTLYENRSMDALLLDAILKYQGFAFQWAYMNRNAKDPITFNPKNLSEKRFVFVGEGMDFQTSYIFPSNYEISGRFSQQKVAKEIYDLVPNQNQYTLGLTKYVWEHSFKVQLEGGFDQFLYKDKSKTQDWYSKLQLQIGI